MPASMISAEIGGKANVTGSSMAMVAVGPRPGNTPISGAEKNTDETVKQIDRRDRGRQPETKVSERDSMDASLADSYIYPPNHGPSDRQRHSQAL